MPAFRPVRGVFTFPLSVLDSRGEEIARFMTLAIEVSAVARTA